MRRSIRVRLLVWMLAFLIPLSVAAGWLLIQMFGNRLLHDIDVALQEEAETIAELLGTSAEPRRRSATCSAASPARWSTGRTSTSPSPAPAR